MTPEEQKAADDKKKAEKDAAEAAKKMPPERVAELSQQPVVIVGGPGVFNINGPGLGKSGRLTIGGHDVPTTRWEDRTVRGEIPDGLKGEVVLETSDGVIRKGVYPAAPAKVKN